MTRAAWVLAVALLCVGCAKAPRVAQPATRDDLYVLLPGADGKVGALIVTHQGQERVLDSAHAAARIRTPGTVEAVTSSDEEARRLFAAALRAQPPRPSSFVLYFLHDSDEFTPESKQVVEGLLNEISRRPAPEVVVIGHTDTMGTDEYNDRLSMQRAERVRLRLIELGITADRILAAGRGKRELLVPTGDQVAEPKNRRVEIVVK
jgi:outer membrane protein OmpA-like peptidoglycan-associated protein